MRVNTLKGIRLSYLNVYLRLTQCKSTTPKREIKGTEATKVQK